MGKLQILVAVTCLTLVLESTQGELVGHFILAVIGGQESHGVAVAWLPCEQNQLLLLLLSVLSSQGSDTKAWACQQSF